MSSSCRRHVHTATAVIALGSAALATTAAASTNPPDDTMPGTTIDVAAMDPDGVVAAAVDGLADYLASFDVLPQIVDGSFDYVDDGTEIDELSLASCPLLTADELAALLESVREDLRFEATDHEIDVIDEEFLEGPESSRAELIQLRCGFDAVAGVAVKSVGVFVADYADPEALDEFTRFLETGDAVVAREPSRGRLGGTIYRVCYADEEAPGCAAIWIRGTLVVNVFAGGMTADDADFLADSTGDLVPEVLQRLADGLPTDIEFDVVYED